MTWTRALLVIVLGACDADGGAGAVDAGDLEPRERVEDAARPADADATEPDAAPPERDRDAAAGDRDAAPGDRDATPSGPDAAPAVPDAAPAPRCDFSIPGPADRDRVVLLGFPFGAVAGMQGTEIGSFTLSAAGEFSSNDTRVDVGDRPGRLLFVPSGELALVLGQNGVLSSVRVRAPDALEIADQVQLPSADYGDLVLAEDAFTLYVAGANSTPEGGISTVLLDCDGSLTVVREAFYPLRLTDSIALLPDGERAVVRGGQALFEPIDHDDLRLLHRTPAGWAETDAADIYVDHVGSTRVALSPDGRRLLIPNGSIFSNEYAQMVEVSVGEGLAEAGRLMALDDPRDVVFSADGGTALLALGEPGVVVVLAERDGRIAEVDRVRGIGLADQMALVSRGRLAGRVLLPSVDPAGGSNLAQLHIDGPGRVRDLGQTALGGGGPNIPTGIAIQD